MKFFKSNRWMGLLISLVFMFSIFVTFSTAQEKFKVSGKITMASTSRPSVDVGDVEGHILMISKWEGTNVCTSEHKFMDDAKVLVAGFGDYIKGNGPNMGYTIMVLNGDAVHAKFKGKTTTTLVEGNPVTTFKMTFTFTKGTGKYENIQGSGNYKAKMISATELVTDWEGEYFIKK